MEKIKVIIICLIAITMTCAFCIGLIAMSEQTTTVKLSETCSIDVKGEFETVYENGLNRIKIYDKFGNNKSTIVYSGANAPLSEVVTFGMLKMMFVGNTWDTGAEPMKTKMDGEEAYVIYTGNNITHDNILIISKNRDDCIKMYNSIKYNTNGATKSINNTTIVKEEVVNYNINVNTSTNNNKTQANYKSYEAPNGPTSVASLKDRTPSPSPTPTVNNTVK